MKDITGNRYGMLTVIGRSVKNRFGEQLWLCTCDCGKERDMRKHRLVSGQSTSCGCDIFKRKSALKKTHGRTDSPEYKAWISMKARCLNETDQSYPSYGGRGITVCEIWKKDFQAFIGHVGNRPFPEAQIDRINNDGNYEPGNVRWTTRKENTRNRRISKIWSIKGHTFNSLDDAAIFFRKSISTVYRWCNGGNRTTKKPDCSSMSRYDR